MAQKTCKELKQYISNLRKAFKLLSRFNKLELLFFCEFSGIDVQHYSKLPVNKIKQSLLIKLGVDTCAIDGLKLKM